MLVIADASPLNVLIRIRHADILPKLFGDVTSTPAVARELSASRAPTLVREWIATRPSWLHIRTPARLLELTTKGQGEREAISLAVELRADLLLVDDLKARQNAIRYGLTITAKLLDLEECLQALQQTDFRIDPILLDVIRRRQLDQDSHQ